MENTQIPTLFIAHLRLAGSVRRRKKEVEYGYLRLTVSDSGYLGRSDSRRWSIPSLPKLFAGMKTNLFVTKP